MPEAGTRPESALPSQSFPLDDADDSTAKRTRLDAGRRPRYAAWLVAPAPAKTGLLVLVVGHLPRLEAPDGVAAMLRQLGAEVHTLDLWDDFASVVERSRAAGGVRAMVFEAGERPDLASAALRAARKVQELEGTPTIVALPPRQITSFDPASGFDDFIVVPCVPAEIYARIRALEWDRSEFSTEERLKVGALVVDRAAHEVTRRRSPRRADREGVRAALLPGDASRARALARDAAGARVGQPLRRRRADRRHPRASAARQAGRRTARSRPCAGPATSFARRPRAASGEAADCGQHRVPFGDRTRGGHRRGGCGASRARPAGRRRGSAPPGGARARHRRVAPGPRGEAGRGLGPRLRGPSRSGSRPPICPLAIAVAGRPSRAAGAAQLAWIDAACDLGLPRHGRRADHGPGEQGGDRALGRARVARAFLGHTEHLQRRLRAREVVMAFWSPALVTSLATTHLPLAKRAASRDEQRGRPRDVLAGVAPVEGRRADAPGRRGVAQSARGRGRAARATRSGRRIGPGSSRRARASRPAASHAKLEGPVPAESAFRLALGEKGASAAGTEWWRCTTTRRPSR